MSNSSVRKLNNDLSRMKHAQAAEKKAEAAEKKAKSDGAKAQADIKASEQKIIDQFTSATPPDSATQANLLGQLFTLGQQSVSAQSKFDTQAAKDKSAIAKDRKSVKADRKQALKDLKPAEYHLGLKATNRDRKELGLKSVNKVIRPPQPQGKKVTAYYNGSPRTISVVPVGNGQYLRADAAAHYKKMVAAAAKAGIHLTPDSGFRSMAEQQHLYQLYLSGQGNLAAKPGYSNHQGGVAMDIGGVNGYGTAAYNWLRAHAGDYGFRNTVSGEFWHWSYGVNG